MLLNELIDSQSRSIFLQSRVIFRSVRFNVLQPFLMCVTLRDEM
jgi:hypothetical protein